MRIFLATTVIALFVTACASTGEPTTTVATPTAKPRITEERLTAVLEKYGFTKTLVNGCGPAESCHPFTKNGLDVVAIVKDNGDFGISPVFFDKTQVDDDDQARLVDAVVTEIYGDDVARTVRGLSADAMNHKGEQRTILVEDFILRVKYMQIARGWQLAIGVILNKNVSG